MKADLISELFRQYYNEALLYTVTLCRSKELAEDVVATAFFKALQMADDDIREFKPWLLTVCRNELMSRMRKRKHLADEALREDLPSGEDPAEELLRQERYRALYRAISQLKTDQREVIELFYFSGLSVRQCSTVVGKSEANVRVLLHRARAALKIILEEAI